MAGDFVQVNVNLTAEDAAKVDEMMKQEAIENRSAFIRRLIRREYTNRSASISPIIKPETLVRSQQEG